MLDNVILRVLILILSKLDIEHDATEAIYHLDGTECVKHKKQP